MVEEIAKKIYTDWNKYYEGDGLSWEELPKYRKATYTEWVKEYILTLIRAEIEKVENPYDPMIQRVSYTGFEKTRQAILALFKEKGDGSE